MSMNPLENRGGIRPLPPTSELKTGTSPKLEAQIKLSQKAAAEVGAPPSKIGAVPFATRPGPGQVFAGKLTDPANMKYSALKEVSWSLNQPKVAAPSNKPDPLKPIFNPTQAIDKIVDTQKNLETLKQQLTDAQVNQRNLSNKELRKDNPEFFSNLLKGAEGVKELKVKVQAAEAELKKLDPENKAFKTENTIGKTITEVKPPMTKSDRIMGEMKSTEATYVSNIKKMNSFLGKVMEKDEKFKNEFFETKIIIERHVAKAAKFENNLKKSNNLDETIKCYEEGFSEYKDSMAEFASIFEKLKGVADKIDYKAVDPKIKSEMDITNKKNELASQFINPIQRMPRHILLLKELLENTDIKDPRHARLSSAKLGAASAASNVDYMSTSSLRNNMEKLVDNFKQPSLQRRSMVQRLSMAPTNAPSRETVNVGKMLSEVLVFSNSPNDFNRVYAKNIIEKIKINPELVNFINNDKELSNKFKNIIANLTSLD